mmetsp:Transcript_620/g.1461  ORF Transcript_620/g.1461 Transcript_620/m.1461 type:complete len:401 (+) Transcript_620:131-1333(+)
MLHFRLADALGTQLVQLLKESVDVLQQRLAGLWKVLLMNLPLLFRVPVHMSIVELLLHIAVAGQLLVKEYVPNFLAYIAGFLVEQHARIVVAHVLKLSRRGKHKLTKSCRRRLIQEPISGKEVRWVRRITIAHAQGRPCRDVARGIHGNGPIVVVIHSHLGLRSMIEHITHRDELLIIVRTKASREYDVERPRGQISVSLDGRIEAIDLLKGVVKVVQLDLLPASQAQHQRWQAFVTKVRHRHCIVEQPRHGIQPGEPRRILALAVFQQNFDEEVELRHNIVAPKPAELRHGLLHGPAKLLLGRPGAEDHVVGYEEDGTSLRETLACHDVVVETVLRGQLNARRALNTTVGYPLIEGLHLTLSPFTNINAHGKATLSSEGRPCRRGNCPGRRKGRNDGCR